MIDWNSPGLSHMSIYNNPRKGEPFEHIDPDARCSICNCQTSAYLDYRNDYICIGCLENIIKKIKETILNGAIS